MGIKKGGLLTALLFILIYPNHLKLLNNDEEYYEKYFDDLVGYAQSYLIKNYRRVWEVSQNGDYKAYFYKNDLNFETIQDLENYFGI